MERHIKPDIFKITFCRSSFQITSKENSPKRPSSPKLSRLRWYGGSDRTASGAAASGTGAFLLDSVAVGAPALAALTLGRPEEAVLVTSGNVTSWTQREENVRAGQDGSEKGRTGQDGLGKSRTEMSWTEQVGGGLHLVWVGYSREDQ